MDLTVNSELKEILPKLTKDERKQLETNIKDAGYVRDPIVYADIDGKHVVIDGMNRLEIATKGNFKYTEELEESITTLDAAAIWILNNQLGRRNLLKPAALRKVRGDLYNRLKGGKGGSGKKRGQNEPTSNAAEAASTSSGVSRSTVKRDGKFAEACAELAKPLRDSILAGEPEKIGLKSQPTDAELKHLVAFDKDSQVTIVRAVRVGQEPSLRAALESQGCKFSKNGSAKKKQTSKSKDPLATQRSKTVKTAEALMRAFDDLHDLKPKPHERSESIACCKILLKTAKEWK